MRYLRFRHEMYETDAIVLKILTRSRYSSAAICYTLMALANEKSIQVCKKITEIMGGMLHMDDVYTGT
ncbi:hypothetical protein NQ317_013684 [Molorchus minor]|uniref:Uncharacterized protein n=1 Tax=Molorchus minor TaxID=1323400 RepID=A0ABQ9JBK7_9CUCU|nr:hypothetical protein NQ317_013684 [Molorchus minor]